MPSLQGRTGCAMRLALLAAVMLLLGTLQWLSSLQTAGWTATSGEILHSETRPHDLDGERLYYLSLAYRYEAGGEWRTGRRVTIAGGYGSRLEELLVRGEGPAWLRWWWRQFPVPRTQSHDALADMAGRFPPGARATVYFDPENPSEAVLVPSTDHAWFGLAAIVFIVALLVTPFAWARRGLWRAVAGFAPGMTGVRRGFAVLGCVGLGLILWSILGARQARQAPPQVSLEELCQEQGEPARWVSLEPDFAPEGAWQATGLDAPTHARCPAQEPVKLPLDFRRDALQRLEGCRVALIAPPLGSGRTLDFGETRHYDELDQGRYQTVYQTKGDGAGLWLLSRRDDEASGESRDRWEGRLVTVSQLGENRRHFRREWSSMAGELAGAGHVLLSDRATPVEQDRLRLFGRCAVALLRDEPEPSARIWARARRNWRDWPDPVTGGQRPVLLDVYTADRYARSRTALWDILGSLGWSLVLFGLVPLLISWFSRLSGSARHR